MSDVELRKVRRIHDSGGGMVEVSFGEPTVEELVDGLRDRINTIEDHHVDRVYAILGAWLLGHPEYRLDREVVSDE